MNLTAKTFSIAVLSTCCSLLQGQVPAIPSGEYHDKPFGESDIREFSDPSPVFYPETWFHYIGGNVSTEGITADLEAIAGAGFSGVQLFHGQFGGIWPGCEDQITCLSPMWDSAVKHTALECRRLGLRFTMQGCPGWAMAGGPWIKPENAMRHLVWSRTDLTPESGQAVLAIPQPSREEWRDYRDIMVLAFPTPEGDTGKPLVPEKIDSNVPCGWESILSGTAKEPLHLAPSSQDAPYWIKVSFPENVVIRSVEFPCVQGMNHGWCYDPGVHVRAEAVLDDGSHKEILNTWLPQSNWQDDRPLTLSCMEVQGARTYLIKIANRHDMTFPSLLLSSAARKNNWESEAGWTLRGIERKGDGYIHSPETYIDENGILDLTDRFDGKVLDWKAPSGKWTVLRIGHVNTGMKNGPAPEEGTGWECDKLSTAGSDAQFDGYIGRLTAEGGPLADGLLNGLLFDSWECKTQTWTENMEAEFETRTDYPLRKWIPALFGYVIDSPETTFRFLCDWRDVIGDLMSENFYGNMRKHAGERGMSFSYETSAGDVFPADIMEYFKYADVPMCEFWQPRSENYVGSFNFKPIKPTASAARLYGKHRVAAESFTSFAHTWDEDFRMLKSVADKNMTEGVTHLVFHTCTHNPQVGFLPPGTSFSGAGIGTPFLRGQTWWKYMPDFTAYFARCSYMLERGRPVSDVLWYLGDETDAKPDQETGFPEGYKYDYCNPDVLLNRLSVEEGDIVTPEGLRYRVLWLPGEGRMRPETLEKILGLVRDGATIVGNAPNGIATLTGGKAAQRTFSKAVKSIWGDKPSSGIRTVGKGKVVSGIEIGEALRLLGIEPDMSGTAGLGWLHRQTENADWYFITAPEGSDGFSGRLDFRSTGNAEIWDPVSGEITAAGCKAKGTGSEVELTLAKAGSCFIVFHKDEPQEKPADREESSAIHVGGRWTLEYPDGWGAPDSLCISELAPWKDLDVPAEAKHFSGTVRYTAVVNVDKQEDCRYILDLGKVDDIASVSVNGTFVRNIWCEPYKADITEALSGGQNVLRIEVTGTWFNRLVYDAAQKEQDRKTWVLKWPSPAEQLRESGLTGPVEIKVMTQSPIQ